MTPGARRTRDAVYAALHDAGVGEADAVQLERILATAVLGFAASEAGGRFAAHSPQQLDADFQLLQDVLAEAVARAMGTQPPVTCARTCTMAHEHSPGPGATPATARCPRPSRR